MGHLDKNVGIAGAIMMDLSKAVDTLNHELLIAKLEVYGFDISALAILLSYMSDRWQRKKNQYIFQYLVRNIEWCTTGIYFRTTFIQHIHK